jgi:hypothetical protein
MRENVVPCTSIANTLFLAVSESVRLRHVPVAWSRTHGQTKGTWSCEVELERVNFNFKLQVELSHRE